MGNDIVARTMEVLASNPTAAELDFLVQAHNAVGYLAASAETAAEEAEARRKYETNVCYVNLKLTGEKMTDKEATARAEVAAWSYMQAEVKAAGKARQLKNLLSTVTEAINAIKFLGRYDSPSVRLPGSRS